MVLVNLTPHDIVVFPETENEIVVPRSGMVVRCLSTREVVGSLDVNGVSIPVTKVVLGENQDLPEPEDGTMYIVSLATALRAAKDGRVGDLLVPDLTVRNANGKIIGCNGLARQ